MRSLIAVAVVAWAGTVQATDEIARGGRVDGRDSVAADGITADGTYMASARGMRFDDGWVTMGHVPALGLETFTLETWFRYDGPGDFAYTGWVGISAYPMIMRGRYEAGGLGNDRDMNYFLGLDHDHQGNLVLAADFEDSSYGANNPVIGHAPVDDGQWHHAAATYDGAVFTLYLDGRIDGRAVREATPRADSVQHVALGTALDSHGVPDGALNGALDEVRIWNYARTAAQIRATLNARLEPQTGLVGIWRLRDLESGIAVDESGFGHDGTLVDIDDIDPAPLGLNRSPEPPARIEGNTPNVLRVAVADLEQDTLKVTFRGRVVAEPREDAYRMVVLPDTQIYVHQHQFLDRFQAQIDWIVDQHEALNIVYVAHVGDIVHVPDWQWQWDMAADVLAPLDATGVPYGFAVGNHDEDEPGNPASAIFFNQYFPTSRYEGVVPWYGGHYGNSNNNSFLLFSAGGDDFIAIHTDYAVDDDVLNWVEETLAAHADRRAIIVSHNVMFNRTQGNFTNLGQPLFDAVADHANVFMMLSGHVYGEGRRVDVMPGHTIDTLMANYQGRRHGGDGFLRILEFAPGDSEIRVFTYSPFLDRWETDENSRFDLHAAPIGNAFSRLRTIPNVASGSTVTHEWGPLSGGRTYEWKVVLDDGTTEIHGPIWTFEVPALVADVDGDGMVDLDDLIVIVTTWGQCPPGPCPGDLDHDGTVDIDDLIVWLLNWA